MLGIEVNNVKKSYGSIQVLNDVSFRIAPGEVVAIIGRSGSGKSTILRCLNGLEAIDSGSIHIGSQPLPLRKSELRKLRQRIGIVFQSYNLFPHLSVEENVTLALRVVKNVPRSEAASTAARVLSLVGLFEKRSAYPDKLSGGQQQRVAIARALAMDPDVMLFDEVTSALDPELKEEVLRVMENLTKNGMTMVLVTHEMKFAQTIASRTIFMCDGKVGEIGPSSKLFASPETAELRLFLKPDL
jgi:polar amino acid transport system ATP-binding protein